MSKLSQIIKGSSSIDFIRSLKEFDNHEIVTVLSDKKSGLHAYVAIHSSRLGMAHGGTRMKIYKDETAALKDVLNLSKAMSYKSALASLRYGGAKGVIVLKNNKFDRDEVLAAYARKIEQLNGLFHTGTDVGLDDADIVKMSEHTQFMLGVSGTNLHDLSTSKAAALGVYKSIKTAAKFKYNTSDLASKLIAIKGLGKLGGELAELLYKDNALLIVADTDAQKIDKFVKNKPNVKVVSPDEIRSQKVHIYAPCALGDEFNKSNVGELNCEVIAGGANNQLADLETGDKLFKLGILYAPDYVVNAGGLIFVSDELEPGGPKYARIIERLNSIEATLLMIFMRAAKENLPTHRIADIIAQERINKGSL